MTFAVAAPYLYGAGVALFAGLDRTAFGQFQLSRPLVAAPLTGLLLGDWTVGLLIGSVLELLWLGRLPVGATIPHDDTQVAVGATVLALSLAPQLGLSGAGAALFCTLCVMPFAKAGQVFDRLARERNLRLYVSAEEALAAGQSRRIDAIHCRGLLHFGLAALAAYVAVIAAGTGLVRLLAPFLADHFAAQAREIRIGLILTGVAILLPSLNLRRAHLLFAAGFSVAFLLLTVLQ